MYHYLAKNGFSRPVLRFGLNRRMTENGRTRTSGRKTPTSARRASIENERLLEVTTSMCSGACVRFQLRAGLRETIRYVLESRPKGDMCLQGDLREAIRYVPESRPKGGFQICV